jgi:hypothetical protein
MLFKGNKSFICYLAHVLNLVAKLMLKVFKVGSHKDAKRIIKQISTNKRETFQIKEIPKSTITQLQLIIMWILASDRQVNKYMEYASVTLNYNVDTQWNALLKMLEIAIREQFAINHICKEYKPLEPLVLSELKWIFLGNIYHTMFPLYKKTLLVSQTNPTIFQSAETYWDLDDHFNEIIKTQGAYVSIDIQIQEAARVGQKALNKYMKKIDIETLIIYSTAALDPRIKTELLKIHLRDNAINVIDNL